ncbi:MAG TPA: type ISP restriction/modification enzyme [Abditibacteriaceae bacterium]
MNTFEQICHDYLQELQTVRTSGVDTPEMSLRTALENFLNNAAQSGGSAARFVNEGQKIAVGRPDFTLVQDSLPLGYVEAEKPTAQLKALTGTAAAQNQRFRQLDHFLLTNHYDWELWSNGKLLGEASFNENNASTQQMAEVKALLDRFLSAARPVIKEPSDLARYLSVRTQQLRDAVRALFESGEADGELNDDYEAFKMVLLPDLRAYLSNAERKESKRPQSFDDLYAQTIAYGLFAARCGHKGKESFTRRNAADYLGANPFLKKLFSRLTGDLHPALAWVVEDMAALLDTTSIDDIREYFFRRTGRADPMMDFYEPFLRAYDADLREVRGVYYTPEPVVGYIVRSLDVLLQKHFGLSEGLADAATVKIESADGQVQEMPRVLLLDPATGTGSFLFAAIDHIHDKVAKRGAARWKSYAANHLLERLFGFELLMAPYSIAHLKLALQMEGKGTPLADKQRFGVYLTNTLDEAVKQSDVLMGRFISDEANAAVAIKKDKPILVVLGNPPYAGHSANASRKSKEEITELRKAGAVGSKSRGILDARTAEQRRLAELTAIGKLIDRYKFINGVSLKERNLKWLQNDYVKFLAFAEERIKKTGEGLIGFITDNSYIDSPTFRGFRWSLMQTFTDIYVYDLHGNSKKKEKSLDGSADENVFDITQGTAIILCVKEKDKNGPARVHHADLRGRREDKYTILRDSSVETTAWTQLTPETPSFYFMPQNTDLLPEYQQGWKVTDICIVSVLGFQTHRDHFAIDFDERIMNDRISAMHDTKMSDDELRQAYKVADNRDWKVAQARIKLRNDKNWQEKLIQFPYRPFDNRFCYFSEVAMDYPRSELMRHMFNKENLALNMTRQTKAESWQHAVVSNKPTPAVFVEVKDGSSIFPLYRYPNTVSGQVSSEIERSPNFSPSFLKALAAKLNLLQEGEHGLLQGITPEDIFHYAYAIFHAPSYRERYAEFLKRDFPRLPLTSDLELFRDLATLGQQLVALHLLDVQNAPALNEARHRYEGSGDDRVDKPKVKWHEMTERVTINGTQSFEDVPREVWEFQIGGYQVAERWLKDRGGRILSYEEQTHYERVLIALAETIRLMDEIDERIPSWPLT